MLSSQDSVISEIVSQLTNPYVRLSCCINAFIFCVHYLCLIGRVYMFYVGHVDKSSLYEALFHCNILSEHHHHQYGTAITDKHVYG
jgi:hypothetical protein